MRSHTYACSAPGSGYLTDGSNCAEQPRGVSPPWYAREQQAIGTLLWDRSLTKEKKALINPSIDFSVHGHNTTQKPYWLGNSYHLDTNYLSGKPTIIELSTLIKQFSSM